MKIKDTPKIDRSREITRKCAICGKKIAVKVFADKKYTGGHYFGYLSASKNKKMEYWECNGCYNSN